ncbi:MAG: tRNA (N6-threonylcarbamoyladenosine(37)-N6)-methyltransferase TrmO [Lachnospiraceae bacterium]|nr:tRNA (N6-threonylcarbamoyladenosine(37)-N6)-methyltransferase TrmO [Lachnospiraceae bacterium]
MKIIARMHTDFSEKFGIPRQSGLVENLRGRIVFEPQYRSTEALKGLEEYSHLWVIWQFSKAQREGWSATVRPPRLGGKKRVGVFASRSPFRPNPIGLSSVKIDGIVMDEKLGPVICVSGIDMLDGTPIYDIKPYLSYCDSHPEAKDGFAQRVKDRQLKVQWEVTLPEEMKEEKFVEVHRETITKLLAQDPRTAYLDDEDRIWGMTYAGYNIKFKVKEDTVCIVEIEWADK